MWRVIDAERRCSGSSLPNLYYPVAGPAAFRDLAYLRRESGSPKPRNYDLIANLASTDPAADEDWEQQKRHRFNSLQNPI